MAGRHHTFGDQGRVLSLASERSRGGGQGLDDDAAGDVVD